MRVEIIVSGLVILGCGVKAMTIKIDVQRVLAYCEAAKASYALMAESAEEPETKQMMNSGFGPWWADSS